MPYRLKMILEAIGQIWPLIITHLPGEAGFYFRERYWRSRLGHCGQGVRFGVGVDLVNPEMISIADDSFLDRDVVVIAGVDRSQREVVRRKNRLYPGEPGWVTIGSNVHIGDGCILSGIDAGVWISDYCSLSAACRVFAFSNHFVSESAPERMDISVSNCAPADRQTLISAPVFVGHNSALALNVILLPGAAVRTNSLVAIGSVVYAGAHKANSILVGNPAWRTKPRFPEVTS